LRDKLLSEEEKKVLDIIGKRHLVRKSELTEILESDGTAFKVVENLKERGLVLKISPLGEISYSITKSGLKALNEKS